MPRECLYHRSSYYHHGSSMLPGLLLLLALCALAGCLFHGRSDEPEVMVVQQPGYAIGPNGQPMAMGPGGQVIVQQGGYGGGMGVAGGAATGFVGGMLVGEMLDHGGGYGGGYGGEYGGGYGGARPFKICTALTRPDDLKCPPHVLPQVT